MTARTTADFVRAANAPFHDDDPFAFSEADREDHDSDEWLNLPGESSKTIAQDMLLRAIEEDPFQTSNIADCLPAIGVAPSALSRYERASDAYISACYSEEQDDDRQEILRLIAAYWLRKSRAFWLD